MKFFLILAIAFNLLLASSDENKRETRIQKQIEIEMEKEKKYSREQTFYSKDNYDLKGAEVNKDSLHSLPDIVEDDFDMDSVYD